MSPAKPNFDVEKPENRELFIISIILAQYFDRLRLQEGRIKDGLKSDEVSALGPLFADIHFYLNTVSNIQKILLRIRQISNSDQIFVGIYKKYIKKIEEIDKIRDHLEHITENRLQGKDRKGNPLKDPNTFGNLSGDEYNFCGEIINLPEMFNLMSVLESEIKIWDKYYPLAR